MMRNMLRTPVASAGFVIVVLTLAGVLGVLPGPKVAFASGKWAFTGSMHTARSGFTLTQFKNGNVLAAGGVDSSGNSLSSAELYNPTTGIWSLTGSMHIVRYSQTATLLPSGNVLVAGGSCSASSCSALATAELYNPTTGKWSLTGSMHIARENQTATLLPTGNVLVAGGDDGNQPFVKALASAELYNPTTGTWSLTGSLHVNRFDHSATSLGNGDILVAGGDNGAGDCCVLEAHRSAGLQPGAPNSPCFCPHGIASAELYNTTTGKWMLTGKMNKARTLFTAISIPDGTFRVVVAGGIQCSALSGACKVYASAEIYNPTTGAWTLTGSLHVARYLSAGAQLKPGTGQVLISGGVSASSVLASTEIFTVSTGTWSVTGSMNTARDFHRDLLLHSGTVLTAGGEGLSSAELFTP